VQNAEPAPAVPAIADLPPSAFAQAPAVMTPATRFEAAVAPPPAIPLVSPSATPFAASSTAAVAEPPTPAPRRFGEPAGLVSAPIVPAPAAPFPRATAAATAPGRPALGVRTVPVDTSMQSRFRLPDPRGAFVIGVVHDLPASRAGVPPGSVIVAINERPVGSPQDLSQLVSHGPVGIPVSLTYVLPGGEAKRAEVVLQPLEAPLERVLVGEPVGGEAISVTGPPILEPTPAVARRIPPRAAVDTVVIMAGGTALPAVSLPAVSLPAVSLPATSPSSTVSAGTITTGATAPPAESPSRERPSEDFQELLRRIEWRLDQLDGLERRLEALEKIERGGR
jgi:membrane-associated protease RseP (regulator of RpoE activity)